MKTAKPIPALPQHPELRVIAAARKLAKTIRHKPSIARDVTEELIEAVVALDRHEGKLPARTIYRATGEDRRHVKRLRKLGASNYEIARALNIPEDAPVLCE